MLQTQIEYTRKNRLRYSRERALQTFKFGKNWQMTHFEKMKNYIFSAKTRVRFFETGLTAPIIVLQSHTSNRLLLRGLTAFARRARIPPMAELTSA